MKIFCRIFVIYVLGILHFAVINTVVICDPGNKSDLDKSNEVGTGCENKINSEIPNELDTAEDIEDDELHPKDTTNIFGSPSYKPILLPSTASVATDCGRSESEFHPWQARLLQRNNNKHDTLCSGTLISKNFVLTSAKCLLNSSAADKIKDHTEIQIGPGFFSSVESFIWSSSVSHNASDEGLLLVEMTKETNAIPACLPPSSSEIFQNLRLSKSGNFASGFCQITEDKRATVNFSIANSEYCSMKEGSLKFCTVCEYELGLQLSWNKGIGITTGSKRQILIGILSEETPYSKNHFTFTNVEQFLPWIKSALKLSEDPNPNLIWEFVQDQLQNKENSLRIIRQISYFAQENIPIEIFWEDLGFVGPKPQTQPDLPAIIDAKMGMNPSIAILLNYSLVYSNSADQNKSISITPKLQHLVRSSLCADNQTEEQILRSSIILLENQFDKNNVDGFMRVTVTHAMVVWEYAKRYENLVLEFTRFHLKIYDLLNLHWRCNETINFAERNIDLFVKNYGENHENVLYILARIIEANIKLNNFEKASNDTNNILNVANKTLGTNNTITLFIVEQIKLLDEFFECFSEFCDLEIPDVCLY